MIDVSVGIDCEECFKSVNYRRGRPLSKSDGLWLVPIVFGIGGGDTRTMPLVLTRFVSCLLWSCSRSKAMGVGGGGGGGCGGHPHLIAPRFDEGTSFGIKHYAGKLFHLSRGSVLFGLFTE